MSAPCAMRGRVVVSRAGHDAGRWYAVLDESGGWLLLVDGHARGLAKPKKKRLKHVRPLPLTVAVAGTGASSGPVVDGDIRRALKAAKKAYANPDPHDKEECAFVQK